MEIIVDVMSGDNAPFEMIKGVCLASKEVTANFTLVGNEGKIRRIANENGFDIRRFDIVHTDEVITMEDDPLSIVRAKKNTSMGVGLKLLAEDKGDAFVSAGNTGALFTGATLIVRKIRGIQRAAIASVLPMQPPVLLLDSGANVTVTEDYLEQFAIMGSIYMKKVYGIDMPRVGLLNNGTEACKGTPLQIEAYKRLMDCKSINFVGNVEGSAIPFDACDVLVCDGFTGNITIKSIEGVGKMMLSRMKQIFNSNTRARLSAILVSEQLMEMKHDYDSTEHGGAPLLGISKPVIKAHGSSNAKAFKNAIRQAVHYYDTGVIYEIAKESEAFGPNK